MEFGKVSAVAGIDFSLPSDPPGNAGVLGGQVVSGAELRLGLTGWGENAWVGHLYPPGIKPADYLRIYSHSFSCVELNSSFYAMPDSRTADRWIRSTPDSFRFMIKIPQQLSHGPGNGPDKEAVHRFLEQLSPFGVKVSACFLQFPPGTDRWTFERMQVWLSHWPVEGPRLFVEFRDPDIFQDEHCLRAMGEAGFGLVITDTPGKRDLVHQRLLVPEVMVRFVSAGESLIDRQRLTSWNERLSSWFSQGLQRGWFFCHTHDNRLAPQLARDFREIVKWGEPLWAASIPEIREYGSRQTELFQTTR